MQSLIRRSTIPTEGEIVIKEPKQHSGISKQPRRPRVEIYLTPEERNGEPRFNKHHRRPRIQGGENANGNVVVVDQESHEHYNQLVSLAAKYFDIPESRVQSNHIARIINIVHPITERLFADPATKVLKSIEVIASEFNPTWLPADSQFRMKIDEGVPTGKLRDFK